MIRVADVRRGSIAADLGIPRGAELLRLDGREIRDALDLRFYEAGDRVQLEARLPDGQPVVYEIEKEYDEALGVVPEPDKIRRCTNACPFCFVKGNPKAEKLRASLYIKDDDYRLSFLHGHYVTLTNLRDEDWERIFAQRLSPLYVSVHATDPEVRRRMLVNPRSERIREDLDRLAAGGIRVHAQAVLCPGVNDGEVLRGTIEDLYARGRSILSFSVVPVGLTRFNADRGVRALTPEECGAALDEIERIRRRALRERGRGWCYAADELFVQAGRDLPPREYFDDRELVANGVGAVTDLAARLRADLAVLPDLGRLRLLLLTGTSMAPFLRPLGEEIARASGADVRTVEVPNGLYGPMVTTAGLLGGRDHLEALRPHLGERDLALFSAQALNERGLFLDDLSLDELRAELPGLDVRPSEHVTDALLAA